MLSSHTAMKHIALSFTVLFVCLFGSFETFAVSKLPPERAEPNTQKVLVNDRSELISRFSTQEKTPVIIKLKDNSILFPLDASESPLSIQERQQNVISQLQTASIENVKTYKHFPFIAAAISMETLDVLSELEEVESIQLDRLNKPLLDETIPFIGADILWNQGFTGDDQTIAILDTGVDNTHPFFSGRVVAEACFSSNYSSLGASSVCAGGVNDDIGVDAGLHCSGASGCDHGTHVAGIAAGSGNSFSGVAKSADIIAVQVFTLFNNASYCGTSNACVLAFDSDIIQGLDFVYELRNDYNIAAANLSLGSGEYVSQEQCDSVNPSYVNAVANLVDAGIAVVGASGNNSYSNGINSPGCVSGAISVGAVNTSNVFQWYSNSASYLDFVAPGSGVQSAKPGGGFQNKQGTSMAAPHVAGAIGLLKSALPSASLSEIEQALKDTGTIVSADGHGVPSINVLNAFFELTDEAPTGDEDVSITLTTDNREEVYFNGELIGLSSDWNTASTFNVALQSGINVLAVKAYDAGGVAALIAQLDVQGLIEVSGDHWKVSTLEEANWQTTGFDDSDWDYATSYGSYGVTPWNLNVSGLPSDSDAEWIWSSDNDGDNIVYFRLVIDNGDTIAPTPPVIETVSLPNGQVDSFYSQGLAAVEGTEPYTWSIASGELPFGLDIDETGVISGTPETAQTANFEVSVVDDNGESDTRSMSITIDSTPVSATSASLVVSADDRDEVYFNGQKIGSNSDWMTASTYNLVLVSGVNVIAIKSVDTGGVAGLIAQLNIGDDIKNSDSSWKVSTAQELGWESTNFDDSTWLNAISYGAYGVAPWFQNVTGFEDSSTAQWIWSDDNDRDNEVYFRLVINVEDEPSAEPPEIVSSELAAGVSGVVYSETLIAANGTAPYSWEVESGALPSGLVLSNDGVISGTPDTAQSSTFSVRVTDQNGESDVAEFSITISAAPQAATLQLSVDNSEEVYFNGRLLGSSSDWTVVSNYDFELVSGVNVIAVKARDEGGIAGLIAQLDYMGLTVVSDTNWRVSTVEQTDWASDEFDDSDWDYATSYGSYGIAPWRSIVSGLDQNTTANWIWSDNNDGDNVVYFRLVINVGDEPAIEPPDIITTELADGVSGTAYSETLSAENGIAPYFWELESGELPSGLELSSDGVISGTPDTFQTSHFSVMVTDQNGESDTAELSIGITNSPQAASLHISVDNSDEVYINGQLVGTSSDWMLASTYDFELVSGVNVIAVKARDAGGVAGLIAQLQYLDVTEISDTHWRVSTSEQANWMAQDFDDSDWDFATSYGTYGVAPWRDLVSGLDQNTGAQWIWTNDNERDNEVFFRLVIVN